LINLNNTIFNYFQLFLCQILYVFRIFLNNYRYNVFYSFRLFNRSLVIVKWGILRFFRVYFIVFEIVFGAIWMFSVGITYKYLKIDWFVIKRWLMFLIRCARLFWSCLKKRLYTAKTKFMNVSRHLTDKNFIVSWGLIIIF
jgi:hypothetical protein